MITKEQLRAMSAFEVNKSISLLIGVDVTGVSEERNWMTGAVADWIGNPNYIMPLSFKHGISLIKLDDAWTATNSAESYMLDSSYRFNEVGGISFFHVLPLRAIACCLILVLQEKKNEH